ncbi:hypothetical protein BC332_30095 [Capsicum chinense]|nr:hypothetical protein BC332_30095 [Capsicum chinense]
MPMWRTDGIILTALIHVGPVEFLYYSLHRALHHHFHCMNAPVMVELEGETDLLEDLLEGMDTPYVDAVEKFEVKKVETKNDEVIEMEMLLGEVFDAVLLGTM